MKPIINPAWFYLINLSGNVKVIAACSFFLLICAWVFYFVMWVGEDLRGKTEKAFRKFLITFSCISFILAIFLPSEKTCYRMMAASLVTPNNIEAVGNTATDIIDYIVDSVDRILDEDDKDAE